MGLDLPEDLGEGLRVTAGLWPVAWTAVACPDGREQGLCRGKGLDAVVHVDARGRLVVTCRESPQRESAWRDWSVPEPLAYSSVFPFRVDATRATLAPLEEIGDGDLALLRLVVESLAAGGRIPERLTLEDRLLGRRVAFDPDGSGRRGDETSLHHMAREAIFEGVHREVRAVALRVASAWLAMRDDVDTDLRLRVAQAAADALPQEPGVLLRLVAARFAALDDAGGFDAVIQAYRLIRGSCPHPIFDHLAFLQSEVDHGLATPTTLGRVAAGICLVCASTTPDRLGFLRDDILDDLRYSGWLVGRDQDRAVLLEVFRVLERLEGRGMLRMAA